MNFAEVKQGLAEAKFTLVDVRNLDEIQANGKIPASVNIPLPGLKTALGLSDDDFLKMFGVPKFGKEEQLVIHCLKGGRAVKAQGIFKAHGYQDVRVYPGSFEDWVAKGGEVERI